MSATAAETVPFAAPALPTPLAELTPAPPPEAVATLRWRRRDEPAAESSTGSSTDDPGPAVEGAPPGWKPSAGAVVALPGPAPGHWLVGVGEGRGRDWRAAGAAAVRALRDASSAALDGSGSHSRSDGDGAERRVAALRPDRPEDAPATADEWAALAVGVVLGSHRFTVRAGDRPALRVHLDVPAEHFGVVNRAVELAHATARARDLADTPSGTKSPAWFAATATALVADADGLGVMVRDETWLAEQGFGGVLAVGGGSSRPPRLLELSWAPDDARGEHVVLVGKGITFDTGGISIKPNAGMADMRTDCAGGAAVVAALRALARLRVPVRVTGLVPLAENHVSGSSYRPGDVVRHRGGTTTEVTNTDAEGRMVLADAIAYALDELAPDVVVDVATLTGAMKVALGVRTGGVFASAPALRTALVDAGDATGEAWWPMPLSADLDPDVDSTIADVRQAPGGPGAIAAALFLRRFTAGRPWIHLDIAGPARCDSPHEEVAKGATGFAARTLVEFCASRA